MPAFVIDRYIDAMKEDLALGRVYAEFLADLKSRIASARLDATRAVNRHLVGLYWDIGWAIREKQLAQGWGDSVVETVSRDLLAAYPGQTGFSASNLWRMRQVCETYTAPEFLAQVVRETCAVADGAPTAHSSPAVLAPSVRDIVVDVPWGHHVNVLLKIEEPRARLYYLKATARFGWSRAVLLAQVKGQAYERTRSEGKTHNFPKALPEHLAEQAEEALKSRYNLEFLGLGQAVLERELEAKLIERLRDFILELGYGFCWIGQQHRLTLGNKEYFVDLLFYHRFLRSLVAVELKVGPFEPEYAGKMDFYLNLLNEKERGPGDEPSIGIILCAEKDNLEVEFSLKTKANPIGVAEYRLQSQLPAALQGKLPTPEQLDAAVRSVLPPKRKH
jgi:predicted nuclease of restriction endonuclease-like (RecB) superfamily